MTIYVLYSKESYKAAISFGAVYYAVQGFSSFIDEIQSVAIQMPWFNPNGSYRKLLSFGTGCFDRFVDQYIF